MSISLYPLRILQLFACQISLKGWPRALVSLPFAAVSVAGLFLNPECCLLAKHIWANIV